MIQWIALRLHLSWGWLRSDFQNWKLKKISGNINSVRIFPLAMLCTAQSLAILHFRMIIFKTLLVIMIILMVICNLSTFAKNKTKEAKLSFTYSYSFPCRSSPLTQWTINTHLHIKNYFKLEQKFHYRTHKNMEKLKWLWWNRASFSSWNFVCCTQKRLHIV